VSLIVQYKAFVYGLYEQMTRRIGTEVDNNNFAVFNAAMVYLPVVLMAELLREFLQYGPEGNPNRAQWGTDEYLSNAVSKTGLLGPSTDLASSLARDIGQNNVPGKSYAGPAVGFADQIADSAVGERSWRSTLVSAAPGAALYKNWGAPAAASGDKPSAVESYVAYKGKTAADAAQ
jgi:hypothetical protein